MLSGVCEAQLLAWQAHLIYYAERVYCESNPVLDPPGRASTL